MKLQISVLLAGIILAGSNSFGQPNYNNNKFKQLKEELATPNVYRTASGAPGPNYYQQQADYVMKIELDDANQKVTGSETVTYTNNSPDVLSYIWLQLDQNVRKKGSDRELTSTETIEDLSSAWALNRRLNQMEFEGGFNLTKVTDASGKAIEHHVVGTMMRIDLPKPMSKGEKFSFKVEWWYNINDRMKIGGRSGYEYFKEEDNYLYTIAQFYPRMCVYNDVEGWQNKQFLGAGEFTLPFGNYEVEITVPADHIVAATGELQNASKVLTAEQRERWAKAKESDEPVFIVTEEEARKAEKSKSKSTKTWSFKAENVRDFAFASSRKFMWDAQRVVQKTKTVMAMSYYPKEGNPLWDKYSTRVVAQTLKTYSKHTFDYPYPVAISVHANYIGMEYPMICFNGGRPNADGTYSERTKYGMHSVIIHEVGHNYFPMIINSDERQWTWMDEGLNTFLQYLTEQEWQRDYPSSRGPAHLIVDYMKGDKSNISPIMTNSESIYQFGNNAYGKPATALNILRETILGRELFDFAFKTYAQRWMFKHPTPADFFRTMEDASGVDLDWFWRGWFYTNDNVDIALSGVQWYQINTRNPEIEKEFKKEVDQMENKNISQIRNKSDIKETTNEKFPELDDKYNTQDPYEVTKEDVESYEDFMASLSDADKALLDKGYNFYQLDFENKGGLVMPIILRFTFEDKTQEVVRIPAEIWRKNDKEISKVFMFEKKVDMVELDPFLETADCDVNDNFWPRKNIPSKFDIFENKRGYRRY
ncbi:M1 family metallopeptidase [Paracrocinitomix mangrovi]|uniref:M1 family metallopeptidase n=1 Tax=Paracrocinitomix mangrovi TaxID=2862509 RepID=UPI001C8DA285|nr:M1 family metallopeptidase [Paracrocinitomix mangrovi]UKN02516.1 M1 family metallopeptidase [Paracrocinitomix mangrovi]